MDDQADNQNCAKTKLVDVRDENWDAGRCKGDILPPASPQRALDRIGEGADDYLAGAPNANRLRSDAYAFRDSVERGQVSFVGIPYEKITSVIDKLTSVAQDLAERKRGRAAASIMNTVRTFVAHNHSVAQDLDRTGRLDDGRSTENILFGKVDLTTLRGGGGEPPIGSHTEMEPD